MACPAQGDGAFELKISRKPHTQPYPSSPQRSPALPSAFKAKTAPPFMRSPWVGPPGLTPAGGGVLGSPPCGLHPQGPAGAISS
jgi:hypothetical protein